MLCLKMEKKDISLRREKTAILQEHRFFFFFLSDLKPHLNLAIINVLLFRQQTGTFYWDTEV